MNMKDVSFFANRKPIKESLNPNMDNPRYNQKPALFIQSQAQETLDGPSFAFSSRHSWMKLGSLMALTGYLSQFALQVLLASGFWLTQSHSIGAMERGDYPYTDSASPSPDKMLSIYSITPLPLPLPPSTPATTTTTTTTTTSLSEHGPRNPVANALERTASPPVNQEFGSDRETLIDRVLHHFDQNLAQFLPLLLPSLDLSKEDPVTLVLFIQNWRNCLPDQMDHLIRYLASAQIQTHFLFRMVGEQADSDTVSFLLDSGLDASLYDAEGKTILHHAVDHQCPPSLLSILFAKIPAKTLQKLLRHSDHHRRTPLDYTLEKRYIPHFTYLVNHGTSDCSATLALKFYQNYVLKNPEDGGLMDSFISLMGQNSEVEWRVALSHMLPPATAKIEGIKAQSSGYSYVIIPTIIHQQITGQDEELIPHNNKYGNHRIAQAVIRPNNLPGEKREQRQEQGQCPAAIPAIVSISIPATAPSCLISHQLYFKLYPAWPEMEEAVGRLTRSIIGFGAPSTDLIKVNGLPVLVSQGIRGETLAEILRNPQKHDILNNLDFDSVSAMILMAMLANPEDGKPESYVVEPHPILRDKYRLVCIDNDQAFVSAFVREKPLEGGLFTKALSTVQVKTILYCLDEMKQPVSQTVRERFLNLKPYEILSTWLKGLKRVDGAYGLDDENAGLFSLTEQVNFFKNKDKDKDKDKDENSFIGLVFADDAIVRLYEKFINLQDCLQKHPTMSHIDLLGKLEPLLVKRYRTALSIPQSSVLSRFEATDAPFYGKGKNGSFTTLNSIQDMMLSLDIPLNMDVFENIKSEEDLERAKEELKKVKRSHGVIAACQQLEKVYQEIYDPKMEALIKQSKSLSDLTRLSLNKNKMRFLKNLDFKTEPTTYQQDILDFVERNTHLPKIQLKNIALLDNKWLLPKLEAYLFGYLTHLSLIGCTNITQDILPSLAQNHPNLKVLNLSNLPHLQGVASRIFTFPGYEYHAITFANLRKLILNNCPTLEAINIDVPNLTHLQAQGTKKLGLLKIKSTIDDAVFYRFLSTLNAPKLKLDQVDLTGCPNISEETKKLLKISLDPVRDIDIYRRFLNGKLIYQPHEDNDEGKVEMRIGDLANPLEGMFDLSHCGDTGNYLSISTGYRKGKKPENEGKVEIWLVPRFLIEKEINGRANPFKSIYPNNWPDTASVGIFWTWGNWDNAGWYDYLTTHDMDVLSHHNLYAKRMAATITDVWAERAEQVSTAHKRGRVFKLFF